MEKAGGTASNEYELAENSKFKRKKYKKGKRSGST